MITVPPTDGSVHHGPGAWRTESRIPGDGIILIDYERARLLMVEGEEVVEILELSLEFDTAGWGRKPVMPPGVPGGMRPPGISGSLLDAFGARVGVQIRRFFRQVADKVSRLIAEHDVDHVVRAGPEGAVAAYRSLLSPGVAARVLAQASIPDQASLAQDHAAASPVVAECPPRQDAQVVSEPVDLALSGGPALLGMDATLSALRTGSVQKVVIAEDCDAALGPCPACGFHSSSSESDFCPLCERPMVMAPLGSVLAPLAASQGSKIIFVRGQGAEDLAPYQGLGALLRY